MTTLPLSDEQRLNVQLVLGKLASIGDKIGAYDYEGLNWRPTGTTVRLTFDRGSHQDVHEFVDYLMQCPALLASCCQHLLNADDQFRGPSDRQATIAKLLADLDEHRHAVAFDADGWMVQHPLSERLDGSLFECEVSFSNLEEPPALGRFWIETDGSLTPMEVER